MGKNDFGVKVSLPGFPVETAADADLYFSSSWPTLKIDDDLSGTVTLAANQVFTGNHNLGYPPFTMLWSTTTGFRGPVDKVNPTTFSFSNTIPDTYRYYITRNPLNSNFQAPNVQLAQTAQGTGNQNFGLKFTKPGKSTDSTDLRDYTIHSGTKSLQVHQVIYAPFAPVPIIGGGTFASALKYITDLPYSPVFFCFYSLDNITFSPAFATSQSPPQVEFSSIDGGVIISNGTLPGWGVFFVLLDPYQSTTQISVVL